MEQTSSKSRARSGIKCSGTSLLTEAAAAACWRNYDAKIVVCGALRLDDGTSLPNPPEVLRRYLSIVGLWYKSDGRCLLR